MPSVLHGGGWQGQSIMLQEKNCCIQTKKPKILKLGYASFYNTPLHSKKCVLHAKSVHHDTEMCCFGVTGDIKFFVCNEYFISVLECIDIEVHRDFRNSL